MSKAGSSGLKAALALAGNARSNHCCYASATLRFSLSPTRYHAPITGTSIASLSTLPLICHSSSSAFFFGICHRNSISKKFGTVRSGRRSPYVVLQISSNASKSEIKAAFRKLAKQHHPDLKMHQSHDNSDGGDEVMAELITAYETLMNKHSEHFWTDARDSRVALAAEIYSIEELRSMRHVFDVYSFRVDFGDSSTDATKCDESSKEKDDLEASSSNDLTVDSEPIIIPLAAHPEDSISDLKRNIQSCFAESWGLDDRRVDRDGLYLGWELVHCSNDDERNDSHDGTVLSYHLFLHSYGIKEGDLLHAIVRNNSEM